MMLMGKAVTMNCLNTVTEWNKPKPRLKMAPESGRQMAVIQCNFNEFSQQDNT